MKYTLRSTLTLAFSLLFLHTLAQRASNTIFVGDSIRNQGKVFSMTGMVTDSTSGLPITGVNIFANGFMVGTTDAQGKYFATLKAGNYRMVFRYITALPKSYRVSLFGHGLLNVQMNDKPVNLEEVEIQAQGAEQSLKQANAGSVSMNIEQAKRLPALLGEVDVIKSLQTLPGVTSVGEGSAGVNVRGGRTDQNLMLMNDVMVLSSNHAMGFLSAFNQDVVSNFTLYKGNVPSYYGGRASATLAIDMKKGDFTAWGGQVSVGTSSNRLFVEGPIIKDKVSLIASGRFSNANWLLRKVKDRDVSSSEINFHDIYAAISTKPTKQSTLDFNILNTGDYFRFSDEFGYDWSSLVTSMNFKTILTERLSAYVTLAHGRFENGFFEPSGAEPSKLTNATNYNQGKLNILYTNNGHTATTGVELMDYRTRPEQLRPYGISFVKPIDVEKDRGIETAFYIEDEWTPNETISLSAGVRASFYSQRGPDTVYQYAPGLPRSTFTIQDTTYYNKGDAIVKYNGIEPRLALRISLGETRSVKLSYSRMLQYMHSISNTTSPTPIDLWQVSTPYLSPQKSHNFSIGYFQNFKNSKWVTSAEFYYRDIDDQIEYKDFAKLFLNNHLETELVQGKGRAYGVEVFLKKNQGNMTGWISYTYSRSLVLVNGLTDEETINNGAWFPSNYDRPHVFSFVMNQKIWPNHGFNLSFNYSTGRPISAVVSNYNVNGTVLPNFSGRNEYRIPNYMRMDISVEVGSVVRKLDDKLMLGVYNLLGRQNAYSVYFEKSGQSFRLTPYKLSILGTLLPFITYTVTFNSKAAKK